LGGQFPGSSRANRFARLKVITTYGRILARPGGATGRLAVMGGLSVLNTALRMSRDITAPRP
jgi:hypothetical protein